MLTVDRIAKVDSILGSIITALYRPLEYIGDKHVALIVNAAYKVAEAKAVAIGKAEAKISDLEDDRAELMAYAVEARDILQRKYRAALDALAAEIAAKDDKISADLAAAAEELVAASKAYDQTVTAAYEKLGVGVEE